MWKINSLDPEKSQGLARSCNIDPVTAQLLINRGIKETTNIHSFFQSNPSDLLDPNIFCDMGKTLQRIQWARTQKQKIMIYGDYDTDGITAASYLYLILTSLKIDCAVRVPNRFTEGYGLSLNAIEEARTNNISLIITVDCGINAKEAAKLADEYNIDLIITDHHKIPDEGIPKAFAVINPQDTRNNYPDKEITGAGVALKLGQHILKTFSRDPFEHFELVALGTISDVAVRLGENRIICRYGMDTIRKSQNLGLLALASVSGCQLSKISMRDIGFLLGPRLNAAGRMDDAALAVELLIAKDSSGAKKIANKLDKLNKLRQKIGNNIIKDAMRMVESQVNFKEEKIIVLASESWHRGLTGIVASRVASKYRRPTCIIALEDGKGVGSARSVDGIALYSIMEHARHLYEDFGGHEGACGFSIDSANIQALHTLLNQSAREYCSEGAKKAYTVECEMNVEKVSEKLINEINLFSPHGLGNPEPMFVFTALEIKTLPRAYGRFRKSFWVEKNGITFEVLCSQKDDVQDIGEIVDVVGRIKQKGYGETKSWQILSEEIDLSQQQRAPETVIGAKQ